MKKYLSIFISSILSGFFITLGVCVYLTLVSTSKILGSLFFGLGLFAIIHLNLYLYTGKVGAVLDNKPKYILDLCVCLIGNILGVLFLASILKLTRGADMLQAEALKIVEIKQKDSWYSIFILSMLCGVMIYLAVVGHRVCPYGIGKVLFCFLAVSIFILCGFEHCVANTAYYTLAGVFDLKALSNFILMILGNAAGAILFDGLIKSVRYFGTHE